MRFVSNYWWLLIMPAALLLWVWSIRKTSRSQWVLLLRFFGIGILLGSGVWLVTGNIDSPYVSLHLTGGWSSFVLAVVAGLAALFGAQHLAAKKRPPA